MKSVLFLKGSRGQGKEMLLVLFELFNFYPSNFYSAEEYYFWSFLKEKNLMGRIFDCITI